MDHYDCAKQRELDDFKVDMIRWQAAQNGSIQRIETKVDEIHQGQMDFYPAFYKLLDGEVDRRRKDDDALGFRITGVESNCATITTRVSSLEWFAKIPGWSWKALVAILGAVVLVLTILAATHVI
jgi:hypothetical protein